MNQTAENYLKGLHTLSGRFPKGVTTNALAEHLSTKASSITDMLKKLHEKGLVKHEKYQGTLLTAKGKKIALQVVRKHRLWEVFLVEKLKFGWDQVHEIAEQLEHIESTELVDRLNDFLGSPRFDPHGDPIPDAKGNFLEEKVVLLSEVLPHQKMLLRGVKDHSTAFLQHLNKLGLLPGQKFQLLHRLNYDGTCEVQLHASKEKIQISKLTAENLICVAL